MFKRKSILFFTFFIATLLIYFESRYSGFVTDYIGFEQNYDKCGFWDYYQCSHGTNFRYLQHAFSYVLYKSVGSDTLIWYVLYCFAHAITAYLFYQVYLKLSEYIALPNSKLLALLASFLFLISPYQSEVVVWRVCIQYNTISICLLLSILLLIKDFNSRNWLNPFLCVILFIIGLLSLEQIVVMPYFLLLTGLFLSVCARSYNNIKRILLAYFIPQHILIALYFLMSKLVYGKWIMHYGAGSYNGFVSVKTVSKIYEYFFKYIFLVRFWENEYKTNFFSFIEKPMVTGLITVVLLALMVYLLKKFIKGSKRSGMLLLFIAVYVVSLMPVIQLYFSTLLLVENDRLGYLSSMFIFGSIVLALSAVNVRILMLTMSFIALINLAFALRVSHYWKRSTQIYYAYLNNFDAYGYKNVYLLGVPCNYHGILMMMIFGPNSGFQEALQYRKKHAYTGNMYDVLTYNQISFDDGMQVQKINDSTLHADFIHYGSWFWKEGKGATDYETPEFRVKVEQYGYTITFKHFDKQNSVILYPYKLKWKQVEM